MTGRIVGIRTVKTQSFDESKMIAGRTENTTRGTESTQYKNGKGTVYLVVDCSGSMEGHKINQVKKGIMEFAQDAIKKDYMVGLIKFDSSATHLCEPKYDIEDLRKCLDYIDARGSTNMAAAISMAHEHLVDDRYKRVMVIATDGRPDKSQASLQAGRIAKTDGLEIITIGTDDADLAFLQKLATSAEYGHKVSSEQFGKAIASAYLQLPDPNETFRNSLPSHEPLGIPQYSGHYSYSF
jgi:Mg-chelatase subunit ChlD